MAKKDRLNLKKANGSSLLPYLESGHRLPVTRREFLSSGVVGVSTSFLVPSVLGTLLMGPKAMGADPDCGESTGGMIPFLTFDLAGGAGLPGNFLVGGRNGPTDLLPSYGSLGWNPRTATLDNSFGLPLAAGGISGFQTGINQTASAGARAGLRFASLCHIGQDDSGINPLSLIPTITRLGSRGLFLSNGLGSQNNAEDSGGRSRALLPDPVFRPVTVQSVTDVTSSVSFGPGLAALNADRLGRMGRFSEFLTRKQAARFRGNPDGDLLATLSGCSYRKMLQFTQGAVGMDPRLEAQTQQVYGINAQSAGDSDPVKMATIVLNVIKGNSGPGCIVIGDCDYHTGSSAAGDAKDLQIGQEVGRAVEIAFQLGKPLFIHLITDGGVSARDGSRDWSSDSGERSMSVIGFFQPGTARTQRRMQIGHYTSGQGAATESILRGEAALASYAALANYMSLNGRLAAFTESFPDVFTNRVDDVLAFA